MNDQRAGRSLEVLAEQLRVFACERDWDQFHSPKNLAMALSAEVGELLEHFQWLTEAESASLSPRSLSKVQEEIGDVLIYLVRLSDKLGVDPLKAATAKLIVNERKYPSDQVRGKAKKYTEYSR
jgi:NTP pyrophosphatase (non-canonical NTP hydrolase)